MSLEVEGLGKEYRLGTAPGAGRSLYESLGRIFGGSAAPPSPRIWALRDVGFSVGEGEVVGVVGRNGAGKSTLLKILSRITPPTTGRARVRGNLASLLEVGTGFHGELSGRENIYLNGTILGMRRREIDRKFDEIAAFSEVERFLDTPVKRYSSGMYVRLAFAVAAHLDADVLLVDEVLAVGDLAFQRKCLGRIEAVATSGRTVLFVSHNLGAVRTLCSRILLLEGGELVYDGPTEAGLERYEASAAESGDAIPSAIFTGPLAGDLRFERFELAQEGRPVLAVDPSSALEVRVVGDAAVAFRSLDMAIVLFRDGHRLFTCHDGPSGSPLPAGRFVCRYRIEAGPLRPGRYTLGFGANRPGSGDWVWSPEAGAFEVVERWSPQLDARDAGPISVRYSGSRGPLDEGDGR